MKVRGRSISVSVMPFENSSQGIKITDILALGPLFSALASWILVLCSWFLVFYPYPLSAELIDRVIAYVDERAITLREFNDYYERTAKMRETLRSDINRMDVLNTFINRVLILREARKLKLDAPTEDELVNEYIELKIKAFVKIREEDIKDFYNLNQSEFGNQDYDSVRDKIEEYLIQRELNRLLKRHIEELRANSYIRLLD